MRSKAKAAEPGAKINRTPVYISGIDGMHPIETGIAYYYRGHYLYGPALNPLEPLPFPTKRDIMLAGTVADTAPPYRPNDARLVPENQISALHKGMVNEWNRQQNENPEIKPGYEFAGQHLHIERATAQLEMSHEQVGKAPAGYQHATPRAMAPQGNGNAPMRSPNPWFVPRPRPSRRGQPSRLARRAHFVQQSQPAHEHNLAATQSNEAAVYRGPDHPANALSHSGNGRQSGHVQQFGNVHQQGNVHQHGHFHQPSHVYQTGHVHQHGHEPHPTLLISSPEDRHVMTPSPGRFYTPHGRAQYLAVTAPGSRSVSRSQTPLESDFGGPKDNSRGLLRSVVSTSELNQLAEREAAGPSPSPFNEPDWLSPSNLSELMLKLSHELTASDARPASRSSYAASRASLPVSRQPNTAGPPMTPIPGLGQTGSSTQPSLYAGASNLQPNPNPLPTGTGRPRKPTTGRPRNASLALNEAYNAANPVFAPLDPRDYMASGSAFDMSSSSSGYGLGLGMHGGDGGRGEGGEEKEVVEEKRRVLKCVLHGDACDGETVTNLHVTEEARQGRGFKDLYPVIDGEDGVRTMVDWALLLKEERAKMSEPQH